MSNAQTSDISQLIDKDTLEELQAIMEDEYIEVLQIYLDESLSIMTDIHAGFKEGSDSLLRLVHTLKSSSNNVGAKKLGEIAEKMETLIKGDDIDSAKTHLDELQEMFTQSHAELNRYIKKDVKEAAL